MLSIVYEYILEAIRKSLNIKIQSCWIKDVIVYEIAIRICLKTATVQRDHSFNTHLKFSGKLTFFPLLIRLGVCVSVSKKKVVFCKILRTY